MILDFIHFSDTHLGYYDLDLLDVYNNNIREEDFYNSFRQIIDYSLESRPDFVIHSGDIFHRSSPSNRPLVFAYEQIKRLTDAGIPFYLIAGNHDYPKSVFTTPIHGLFSRAGKSRIIFSESYEVIENEKYIIHALPHINSQTEFESEVAKIKIRDKSKINILTMHLSVGSYLMDEYGERVFPDQFTKILKEFDYVALGHWHRFNHLEKYGNVYYSGSTERTSENEIGPEKGFIHVSIDKKTEAKFIPIETRIIKKITIKDCYTKERATVIDEIGELLKKEHIKGGIISIHLLDLSAAQVYEITKNDFYDLLEEALHFTITKTVYKSNEKIVYESDEFDLKDALTEGLKDNFKDKSEYGRVLEISRKILSQIEEEESNAD